MPREDEELQSAFEEQAGSADGSRELCDLFGLDECIDECNRNTSLVQSGRSY